jgi:hypothetical protein
MTTRTNNEAAGLNRRPSKRRSGSSGKLFAELNGRFATDEIDHEAALF